MTLDPKVRLAAGAEDAARVEALLRLMHAESAVRASLSTPKLRGTIAGLMRGMGFVYVIDDPLFGVTGSAAVEWAQSWYSEDWHLKDVWVFVHPAHRRSRHAHMLLRALKDLRADQERQMLEKAAAMAEPPPQASLPLVLATFAAPVPASRLRSKAGLYQRIFGPASGQIFTEGL